MSALATCLAFALLSVLALAPAAQNLANSGELCVIIPCANDLICADTRSGKRCVQPVPLLGRCGRSGVVCDHGTRCVLDQGLGGHICIQEVEVGQPCGLPSENLRAVAVCEAGSYAKCEWTTGLTDVYHAKSCVRVVPPGKFCDLGRDDRCTKGHGCHLYSWWTVETSCQNLTALDIGKKCRRQGPDYIEDIGFCKSSSFKIECATVPGQKSICVKVGREGEMCDEIWRHCDFGLKCLADLGTGNRVCKQPRPGVRLGEKCGTKLDKQNGYAYCGSDLRCYPDVLGSGSARCMEVISPGGICSGALQQCADGYVCDSSQKCVQETNAGLGEACGDPLDLDKIDVKCKSGLRCEYHEAKKGKLCVKTVGRGKICGLPLKCPINHECIRASGAGPRKCTPVAKIGESCVNSTCACTLFCDGKCYSRLPCIRSWDQIICDDDYKLASPIPKPPVCLSKNPMV